MFWDYYLQLSIRTFGYLQAHKLSEIPAVVLNRKIIHQAKKYKMYSFNGNNPQKTEKKKKKTSMMWPSQNFPLYNGTIIKIKVNE